MQGWRIFWQVLGGVLPVDHREWNSLVEPFWLASSALKLAREDAYSNGPGNSINIAISLPQSHRQN